MSTLVMLWNGMQGNPNLGTNFIFSMNARILGPVLVFAPSDALMADLPFKDFNALLEMLFHCATFFMLTRLAQPSIAHTFQFTVIIYHS
jgi:hypothetical protein